LIFIEPLRRSVKLGQPHVDPVGVELSDDVARLAGDERPLELADHHRIEPWVGPGSGLRTVLPGQSAGVADVEELDHDPPTAVDQPDGVIVLPLLRGRRVLEPARRHAPVEGEPQPAIGSAGLARAANPGPHGLLTQPGCEASVAGAGGGSEGRS
jgi:hypothetical protein